MLKARQKREEREKSDAFTISCPFKECGWKFMSDAELSDHIDRRHKSNATGSEAPKKSPAKVIQKSKIETTNKGKEVAMGKEQAEILKALMGNPLEWPMTGFKWDPFEYIEKQPQPAP